MKADMLMSVIRLIKTDVGQRGMVLHHAYKGKREEKEVSS